MHMYYLSFSLFLFRSLSIYMCLDILVNICIYIWHTFDQKDIHVYKYIYIYIFLHIYIYCRYTYIHIYIYISIYVTLYRPASVPRLQSLAGVGRNKRLSIDFVPLCRPPSQPFTMQQINRSLYLSSLSLSLCIGIDICVYIYMYVYI